MSALPSTVSALMKLPVSFLKKILKHHSVDYSGVKQELTMRVLLLKNRRSYLIFEKERVLLMDLIYLAKDVIIGQKKMHLDVKYDNVIKRRQHPGHDYPHTSSEHKVDLESTLTQVLSPSNISEDNLQDIFQPLLDHNQESKTCNRGCTTWNRIFPE